MRKSLSLAACILLLTCGAQANAWCSMVAQGYQYTLNPDDTALVIRYTGQETVLSLPQALDGHALTGIGERAFSSQRDLVSIRVPEGVTMIGAWAFEKCESLLSVDLPRSLITIERGVFIDCSNLERIGMDPGNPVYAQIDGVLFDKTQKMLHSFPPGKRLLEYRIPQGIRLIGDDAFFGCTSLTSILIPDSVTMIGEDAFRSLDALNEITIPGSVKSIGSFAFSGCGLTSLLLSEGLQSIGEGAFEWCKDLVEITLPVSLTGIDKDAFSLCFGLHEISIPGGVRDIGPNAFGSCNSLERFRVSPENPVYAQVDGVLYDKTQKMLHTYPNGKTGQTFAIPQGILIIGADAFFSCDDLLSVTIPESVGVIGENAFSSCMGLSELYLPRGLREIGRNAFAFGHLITLHAAKDSYAEQYASDNQIICITYVD